MSLFTYLKSHRIVVGAVAILVVAATVIAGRVANRSAATDSAGSNVKRVSLVDVSAYRTDRATVSADGIVESVSQVDLKSQTSAPVSSINASIGSFVTAGQIIAELQNADVRAQLEQARASLALAEGQYTTGSVSLESAQKTAVDTVRDSYAKATEVVRGQIDTFLYASSGGGSALASYITDRELAEKIRTARIILDGSFDEWEQAMSAVTSASSDTAILNALAVSERTLTTVRTLVEDISTALNDLSKGAPSELSSTITAWKTTIVGARASVSGAQTATIGAETALSSAKTMQESPAEAQISVARAGVKNLEAQLAKTIIRAPISGRVAALPLRVGELASPGELIATVVGSGGLQVRAYASGEDLARLAPGAAATIGPVSAGVTGTVASVAPSVNPLNKKIEVIIRVAAPETSNLVVGQSVQASIVAASTAATPAAGTTASYLFPIQDVKIIPGAAYVYTVDADAKIVQHPVTLGRVSGDFVEVKTGVSEDMKIVSPVYELEEGQTVSVQ